ncbi:PREDICTED: uncharacterized protein LOC108769970, partial [Trachymyrmex cornetzi]|uniref:uncharacterized protein LOC108769970 n=1 Tax=Trachymyrmex cornetzi TaxID=471704 RepID=UPI00084F0CB8
MPYGRSDVGRTGTLSKTGIAIFERQLKKKTKTEFPQILKTFATTLQFYSSRAYNYIRKTFIKSLPHPEIILRWYHNVNGNPGITTQAINTLKLKIHEANLAGKMLHFNLTIDEMSIHRDENWNGEKYVGFVDIGTDIDTDELPPAKYALVFIKLLVELQETEGLHAATKIRRRQLNFYNEKMKVSLAAQVLSTSVANALTFCEQDLQLPPFAGSSATTNFCLQINNIFDLLNGRNRFYKNKSAQCITRENYDEICKQVDNFCIYLTGLKDANEYILKSNRKMGFFGFIVDIKSILEISKSLFQDHNIKYLMTYKLSQDHVETFFSAIRSRGGFNTNPTANQFIAAYKRLLVHADVDISKSANSTIIDETVVLNISTTALTNNTGEQSIIDNLTHDYTEKQDSVIVKSDHNYYHDFHNEWLCSDYIEDV